jgi:ArsR family transcriptional regulator
MKESKDVIDCCQQEESVQVAGNTEERREQLARFCKALAHPARVHILEFLGTLDACMCGDIVEQLPLAQSTVSQHLKVLKEAGLIQGTIDGPRTSYCVNRQALAAFKELVARL